MRLDILGSSGTAPQPGNPASGYLVRGATATLWMDAGPGTYAALADQVDPETLDAVLLSHMHADHCSDLLALFHVLAYVRKTTRPLPVVVPEGAVARWRGFIGDDDDHLLFTTFDFREARSGERFEFGDVTVKAEAASHSIAALAYRLEAGGVALGYTGDTGPSEGVAAHFAGVALLLAEASLDGDAEPYPFHMTAAEAAALAVDAGAAHLLLTHIPEPVDAERSLEAAAAVYPGTLGLAEPGQTYIIEPPDERTP